MMKRVLVQNKNTLVDAIKKQHVTKVLKLNSSNASAVLFSTSAKNLGAAKHDAHEKTDKHHANDHHHDEHHHEEHYTNDIGSPMALPRYKQYKMTGWEIPFYVFYMGGFVVFVILLWYKPDYSIKTWAREEYLRRQQNQEKPVAAIYSVHIKDLPEELHQKYIDERKEFISTLPEDVQEILQKYAGANLLKLKVENAKAQSYGEEPVALQPTPEEARKIQEALKNSPYALPTLPIVPQSTLEPLEQRFKDMQEQKKFTTLKV